jgi:signal transduction histidine kinase
MQDIIWAMKTKNDQLEDLAARMTEFGLRILEARNVRFKAHVSENFSGKQLSPEQRRNAYLIFKEAVNNAAKYADATEVELFLALKKGLLLMKITDNGKGFDLGSSPLGSQAGSSGGNGLQNMYKRAEEIKGRVAVISGPGKGTSVELRVKV